MCAIFGFPVELVLRAHALAGIGTHGKPTVRILCVGGGRVMQNAGNWSDDIGAGSASKWMIPWADQVAGKENFGYKAITQGYWALGAVVGSFAGAQLAAWLGRRISYMLISLGAVILTLSMFLLTAPMRPEFHAIVFAQGIVSTLFFGWLALYLPELFPTPVRATGSGLAYNSGRFATAGGVLLAGFLFSALGGDYSHVGAMCAIVYALGLIVIWFAPDTRSVEL